MDDFHCHAFPEIHPSATPVSETPSNPNDQLFNVNFEIFDEYVVSGRNLIFNSETSHQSFSNVSKDQMMQESTILSWISQMGVPQDSQEYVVANILECARGMANGSHMKILSMRDVLIVTRISEDYESSKSEEEGDDSAEEEMEEISEEVEEDDDFVEEETENFLDEDVDDGLFPAAKNSIEGLEKVGNETEGCVKGNCVICFEDFDVGVRMPCLHMFHKDCITGWLHKANSCPLCRFKMPTQKDE